MSPDAPWSPYQLRVRDAVSALVGFVWIELVAERCADKRKPTREELWPSDAEREKCVEKLVMTDGLAAGDPTSTPGALTTLARAVVFLSVAHGGVKFMGRRYEAREMPDGGLYLHEEEAPS